MNMMSLRFAGGGEGEGPRPSDAVLDAGEIRVLGSLVEKAIATPDYYPLTLNALVAACNQKTARDPVTAYTDQEVLEILSGLKDRLLVTFVSGAEHRVTKYREQLTRVFAFDPAETAAMCVLILRGPLTPGEIRSSSGRLHEFGSTAEVEETLTALAERSRPLVAALLRRPGQKETRWAHLLSGSPVESTQGAEGAEERPRPSSATLQERLERLEAEVADLREGQEAMERRFQALLEKLGEPGLRD